MRRYDAVFLDAQGTLVQAYPSVTSIYVDVSRKFGREVSMDEVKLAVRELWIEIRSGKDGPPVYDTSDDVTREWWARQNGRLFHKLGLSGDQASYVATLWAVFGDPERWRLFPEVETVLLELRRRGYRLGMVSNWDSRLLPICQRLRLDSLMDFMVVSALVGVEKPDSRIFEAALSRGGVEAARAIHVGDDYEADVLGARGAGIDAVYLDRDGDAPRGEPSIRTLEELLPILNGADR